MATFEEFHVLGVKQGQALTRQQVQTLTTAVQEDTTGDMHTLLSELSLDKTLVSVTPPSISARNMLHAEMGALFNNKQTHLMFVDGQDKDKLKQQVHINAPKQSGWDIARNVLYGFILFLMLPLLLTIGVPMMLHNHFNTRKLVSDYRHSMKNSVEADNAPRVRNDTPERSDSDSALEERVNSDLRRDLNLTTGAIVEAYMPVQSRRITDPTVKDIYQIDGPAQTAEPIIRLTQAGDRLVSSLSQNGIAERLKGLLEGSLGQNVAAALRASPVRPTTPMLAIMPAPAPVQTSVVLQRSDSPRIVDITNEGASAFTPRRSSAAAPRNPGQRKYDARMQVKQAAKDNNAQLLARVNAAANQKTTTRPKRSAGSQG